MNNLAAAIFTLLAALVWLRTNNFLAQKGWIERGLSRKIIHIGTGPIFVLCWNLFDSSESARYFAAFVPFIITVQFILVGLGIINDHSAVQAMSRTGKPADILRGPLLYGIVFVSITCIYWTSSPIGITALILLCGGDGTAEIIGRKFGKSKIPWSQQKTWIGSFGMFVGGWTLGVAVLFVFNMFGFNWVAPSTQVYLVTFMAFTATLVETLPYKDVDNGTITLAALLTGHLFLR